MATKKSRNNLIFLKSEEMAEKIVKVLIIEILESGLKPTEIAKRSGMPTSTITRLLKHQRGTNPPTGFLSSMISDASKLIPSNLLTAGLCL